MNGVPPAVATAIALPPSVRAALERHAHVFDIIDRPRATWPMSVETAQALLIGSGVKLTGDLLDGLPGVRLIATQSVGYDNVDLAELHRRGIAFTNSRGSLIEAVADISYLLVIAAMRGIARGINWVRDGRWLQHGDMPFGRDLDGATLGIVGLGDIGSALARRARVSGMRVIYANRTPRSDDAATGNAYRTFSALLGEADCVVALVPLTPQTRGMFDAQAFAAMKPSAVFVNVARGAVADTAALLHALEAKQIAGAALDVTDPEPLPHDHPLVGRDDVLIVPHVGSATVETRTRMAMVAAENVIAYLDGKPLLTAVEGFGRPSE